MRQLYICDPHCYANHQQKGGGFPIYVGAGVQRGHGIGGIFSGLAKMAMPLLKSAAKTAGKSLLSSGAQFAGDVLKGKSIKESAKRRALEAGKNIGKDVFSSVKGMARTVVSQNKKRKASSTATSQRKAKRRRTSKNKKGSDIFG